MKREGAVTGGDYWGERKANFSTELWREGWRAMVSVSGYLIGSQEAGKLPLPPKAELQWWYQFYFVTERGREGYQKYTHDFARQIWQPASPQWHFDDATFGRSAASLDNPDHVAITIHNYRWRQALAEGQGGCGVIVEKPFGTELASARALNEMIGNYLAESQVYRFEHSPGTDTVQNILV